MMRAGSLQGRLPRVGIGCVDDEFRLRQLVVAVIIELFDRQVVDGGVLDIVLIDSLDGATKSVRSASLLILPGCPRRFGALRVGGPDRRSEGNLFGAEQCRTQ